MGVIQHTAEERVEVIISEFKALVTKKTIQRSRWGGHLICFHEENDFLEIFLERLKHQFQREYLYRKKKNDF
jgi:hypothetical protein